MEIPLGGCRPGAAREARSRRRAHPFFSCRQLLLPVACAQHHAAPLTQKTGKVASAGSHVAPASEVLRVQLHEAAAQGGKGLVGVPVEPGVDQRKAGTRKVLALSPHWAGASSSSSEACGAPGTKAAPAAAGSGAWVLRRPLDGLGFHHAQNSLVVDGELPACRVRTGGRGDEGQWRGKAMAPCTSRQAASCQGHEFASALIAGGLSGISADGIFNGLNSLLFLMRGVPECAGGKQTEKRADHGAPRNPPPHLPPAGFADWRHFLTPGAVAVAAGVFSVRSRADRALAARVGCGCCLSGPPCHWRIAPAGPGRRCAVSQRRNVKQRTPGAAGPHRLKARDGGW